MAARRIGISRDLIIHPGETIADILDEREIAQADLAARAGVTPAYISKIISGEKDISANCAQALEYTLGVPKSFWLNLQANYDAELLEYNKRNTITDEERAVRKSLDDIVRYLRDRGVIPVRQSRDDSIITLRSYLQVSNLVNLRRIVPEGCYRISTAVTVNPDVMGAWLRLCQMQADQIRIHTTYKDHRMNEIIASMKQIMLNGGTDLSQDVASISNVLGEYGIQFSVVHNFRGAPVHGYISRRQDDTFHMALTIRGAYADIFWFSLFRELGHINNGDVKKAGGYIDTGSNETAEQAADQFAADNLLDPRQYAAFVTNGSYGIEAIMEFARMQNVQPYIVIGRLQREQRIPYNQYSEYKVTYQWTEQV